MFPKVVSSFVLLQTCKKMSSINHSSFLYLLESHWTLCSVTELNTTVTIQLMDIVFIIVQLFNSNITPEVNLRDKTIILSTRILGIARYILCTEKVKDTTGYNGNEYKAEHKNQSTN